MESVFLTNGQLRKSLAVARSLGEKGINVTVSEVTRFNPTAFSKYCKRSFVCPDAKNSPEEYYSWLIKKLKENHYDVLFPMDDDTMNIVISKREDLEKLCRIPLPSAESYEIASDKGKTAEIIMETDIAAPMTVLPTDINALEDLTNHMNFPVVIKPRKSSGSRGIFIVRRKEDLANEYMKVHKSYPFPLVQEYIGLGERYDVCLLMDSKHQLKASFVQKEIRHFPIDIGPSTVQESVWYPELIEKCLGLMQKLKWYGIVELEFMRDSRDGKLKFMEINPRFWNSLQMSILAGVNFPWLLYKLTCNGDCEEIFTYKTGIMCRWLLPGDILHFLFNKNRLKMKPLFLFDKKNKMHDDIISLKDPLPVLGFILACIRYLFDIKMWKFMFRR